MNRFIHLHLQIIFVLIGAPGFVFIDSPWFQQHYFVGQDINNVLMCLFYCWIFFTTADTKLYLLMMLITVVSFGAEICGSKILTAYQYHLDNIPLFIPLGHAVVYATAYHISRHDFVWKHHHIFEAALRKLAFIICFISLILLNDIAGFFCYLLFLMLVATRKKPLFYLTMYAVSYYLEFLGTVSSAWSYYFVLGNHPNYPPTSIIPCGIAGIYMFVDIVTNSIYLYIKKIKHYVSKNFKSPMTVAS
ncbi:hypothetical protein [Legionella gresilensis]|uniref:hypothetical protein n=1 Tax=Legionella gresilensis TaxID=91823 RepID=UPI0010419601|nr:hypothetical protein [Legionella gresilensis]